MLREGMLFDVNVLDAERQRITDYLLCNGYYKFNKDYITSVSYTHLTVNVSGVVDSLKISSLHIRLCIHVWRL